MSSLSFAVEFAFRRDLSLTSNLLLRDMSSEEFVDFKKDFLLAQKLDVDQVMNILKCKDSKFWIHMFAYLNSPYWLERYIDLFRDNADVWLYLCGLLQQIIVAGNYECAKVLADYGINCGGEIMFGAICERHKQGVDDVWLEQFKKILSLFSGISLNFLANMVRGATKNETIAMAIEEVARQR